MFAPPPNSVVDESGRVLPEVLAARRRGVWFDLGNGQNGPSRWDTVGAIRKPGSGRTRSRPTGTRTVPLRGVIDFPNCMYEAAWIRHDDQRCDRVRNSQCPAHIPGVQRPRHAQRGRACRRTLLRVAGRVLDFLDNYKNTITGRQRLFPSEYGPRRKRIRAHRYMQLAESEGGKAWERSTHHDARSPVFRSDSAGRPLVGRGAGSPGTPQSP